MWDHVTDFVDNALCCILCMDVAWMLACAIHERWVYVVCYVWVVLVCDVYVVFVCCV